MTDLTAQNRPDWEPGDWERWRHGGWYVGNLHYPSGAVGCVSNNYPDKRWRIACDPRPFDQQPTFPNRRAAAIGERDLIRELHPEETTTVTNTERTKIAYDAANWLTRLIVDGMRAQDPEEFTTERLQWALNVIDPIVTGGCTQDYMQLVRQAHDYAGGTVFDTRDVAFALHAHHAYEVDEVTEAQIAKVTENERQTAINTLEDWVMSSGEDWPDVLRRDVQGVDAPIDRHWGNANEWDRYQLTLDPMEAGYLELPPLREQGNAEDGQAILWVKADRKAEPERFIYVWPEDVSRLPEE